MKPALLLLLALLWPAGASAEIGLEIVDYSNEQALTVLQRTKRLTEYRLYAGPTSAVILYEIQPGVPPPSAGLRSQRAGLSLSLSTNPVEPGRGRIIHKGVVVPVMPGDGRRSFEVQGPVPMYSLWVGEPGPEDERVSARQAAELPQKASGAIPLLPQARRIGASKAYSLTPVTEIGIFRAKLLVLGRPHSWEESVTEDTYLIPLQGKVTLETETQRYPVGDRSVVKIPAGFPGPLTATPGRSGFSALMVTVSR